MADLVIIPHGPLVARGHEKSVVEPRVVVVVDGGGEDGGQLVERREEADDGLLAHEEGRVQHDVQRVHVTAREQGGVNTIRINPMYMHT